MSKIKNWQLPILVVIVSVLSLSLIQKYALAQWQNPGQQPGVTGPATIVVNPMTTDLNLNSKNLSNGGEINATKITASGNVEGNQVCIDSICRGDWPTGFWQAGVGSKIHYSETGGNVGIGISDPENPLHIRRTSGQSAELKLQSENTQGWGIYHDRVDKDLNFWYGSGGTGNNWVTFTDDGKVGIGTDTLSYRLESHDTSEGGLAILGQSANDGGGGGVVGLQTNATGNITRSIGVLGAKGPGWHGSADETIGVFGSVNSSISSGKGVWGEGHYGVLAKSTKAGGVGIQAHVGAGSYAGEFLGTLKIGNQSSPARTGYLQLNSISGSANSNDCIAGQSQHLGKMILSDNSVIGASKIYVCTHLGWAHIPLVENFSMYPW